MQAVIESGGKQYLVAPKDKIILEKLDGEVGSNVTFDKVLLLADESKADFGRPYLKQAKVVGKIVSQQRGEKLVIFKYRAKSRYRRKTGHRQSETVVQIETIA
ncbi:MAG: 50S ribosomal protein L21 [Candidatus Doudnabacteria bacterium RIFCSPLOWO2_01_FULL_44_21]|uniref:Large ribosomal subunit protein bL21 n=1 Tax=Candidatus Doudnabacteria bacterium RIFCSPLOWO2_01_FULL_44_21 TaxID=1817841 RepID=A0A1F5PXU8_9BACT|nr:MAG: 50S ribosomal protein L21 [Candidatus Doudnabacteria bacterium RIFCSPHIGHO2_02_FULL_43_13b]OGE94420.1 MAG: 50S ribosomal protein L21 [Candidatus Doudnabacteria bacterium RIFCSPLOWO2_01_FULL_44_21]